MELKDVLKISSLPRPETELLLAFLLNKSREFLLAHPETKISPGVFKKFQTLKTKRLKNWPVAYLIRHKEFYDLDLKVSSATLVPRPETEMIVEKITNLFKLATGKEQIAARRPDKPLIIDLGTGSGAIIIAIAKELRRWAPAVYHRAEFLAVDISADALKMAKQNAKIYGENKKIKFYRGDLLGPLKLLKKTSTRVMSRDLIIAANLPYLTLKQIKEAPSISREPKSALYGGRSGLKYYRALFRQLKKIAFRSATIFCEIDPGQAKKITILAAKYFLNAKSQLYKDYSGQNRLFATKIRL